MTKGFEAGLARTGVIAIMRAHSSSQLLGAAEALFAGGISEIEVALTTPGALQVIAEASSRFGDSVTFGAGTVLDPESARSAILAGARFVVAPNVNTATVELCRRYGVPILSGAYTPSEVLAAWQAGADLVKVFPAFVGGPGYISALRGPLPQVRLCAVGGVAIGNAADFIKAGAEAVGVGGELVDDQLLETRDFAEITRRARQLREEVARARQE